MECEVCGFPKQSATSSPVRGITVDLRTVRCPDCGAVYTSEQKLTEICCNGEMIPINKARKQGLIDKMSEEYIQQKIKRVQNVRKSDG